MNVVILGVFSTKVVAALAASVLLLALMLVVLATEILLRKAVGVPAGLHCVSIPAIHPSRHVRANTRRWVFDPSRAPPTNDPSRYRRPRASFHLE